MNTEVNQEERWRKLLLEHKTTDITIKSFCELNDVRIHQFTYWRDKIERGIIRKKNKKSSFIKVVQHIPKETSNIVPFSIELNKIKINVPFNFDHLELTKLIKVVRSID
jgi:hypothetical protein